MIDYPVIKSFRGEYGWLSNFHPCKIHLLGIEFDCVETAFQASKFKEHSIILDVSRMIPKEAKAFAKKNKGLVRSDWNDVRVKYMRYFLKQKFNKGTLLHAWLLNTYNAYLIEGNVWYDNFWGYDIKNGIGKNMLGQLLMEIRNDD